MCTVCCINTLSFHSPIHHCSHLNPLHLLTSIMFTSYPWISAIKKVEIVKNDRNHVKRALSVVWGPSRIYTFSYFPTEYFPNYWLVMAMFTDLSWEPGNIYISDLAHVIQSSISQFTAEVDVGGWWIVSRSRVWDLWANRSDFWWIRSLYWGEEERRLHQGGGFPGMVLRIYDSFSVIVFLHLNPCTCWRFPREMYRASWYSRAKKKECV